MNQNLLTELHPTAQTFAVIGITLVAMMVVWAIVRIFKD